MRKWFWIAATLCVALAWPGLAPAQEPKEIIAKALKAHGGLEKLKEQEGKAQVVRGKGKIEILGGIDFTLEVSVAPPEKFKTQMQMQIMGQNVNTVQVFNGKDFWMKVNGMSLDNLLDDKAKEGIKEQIYQERMANLVLLGDDKKLQLSPLGESTVEGKPVVGIRVSSEGHKDISLWFEKTTGLLTRLDAQTVDIMSKMEQNTQKIFLDYKEQDGVMKPKRMIMNQDEKKFMEMEFEEFKLVDSLDDSTFAKP